MSDQATGSTEMAGRLSVMERQSLLVQEEETQMRVKRTVKALRRRYSVVRLLEDGSKERAGPFADRRAAQSILESWRKRAVLKLNDPKQIYLEVEENQ
jgi:hypothetical protein